MMSARFIICFLRSLEKDYEKANGKFLMQLGECVARFRLDKLTQRLFNGQKNLQRAS